MNIIKVKDWLEQDFNLLKEEYSKEYKTKYERMFNSLVAPDIRRKLKSNELYGFHTKECCFSDFKVGVSIIVELYIEVIPYFYSIFDLEEHGIKLRNDPKFREFTKFCFYIVETVKPKN